MGEFQAERRESKGSEVGPCLASVAGVEKTIWRVKLMGKQILQSLVDYSKGLKCFCD